MHDGKLVVAGGTVGDNQASSQASSSVLVYDPQADAWAEGVPLPAPRKFCQAINHAGIMCLVGDGPCLCFDGQWNPIAMLPGFMHKLSLVSMGSILIG